MQPTQVTRAAQLAAHKAAHPDLWARLKPQPAPQMEQKVAVHEWLDASGKPHGCGTQVEFDHWTAEGTMPEGGWLGRVLTHEPASEDERRKALWAAHPLPKAA